MTPQLRWFADNPFGASAAYVERMRAMAAEGADLEGEARLLDAMLPRESRVLDAGCGTGRVGAALHRRGHDVVGVDADAVLIAAARADHAGPAWVLGDLTEISLPGDPFDAAVLAGNVVSYAAPGSQRALLTRIAAHLHDDAVAVVGFHTHLYSLGELADAVPGSGFRVEQVFATWDLRPWHDDAEFAVCVLRVG